MTNKYRSGVRRKMSDSKKSLAGILILLVVAVIGVPILYLIARGIAPAFTMGIVHLFTLPAYFAGWVLLYAVLAFACLYIGAKYLQNICLLLVAVVAIVHCIAASSLGELALYQIYSTPTSMGGIPTPAIESAKFVPFNVAETRLRAAGDNSQLTVGKIDEAIIITPNGDSHIGFSATLRARDFETKFSGETELAYIDAHSGELKRKKLKLRVLPGGTFNSDPERSFYSSLPWWDGTSHDTGEIVPIINEKDDSLKLAMPVTTPRTKIVEVFPLSNLPTYSGVVLIDPISGKSEYLSIKQIEADQILSRARLFPHALSKEVAKAARFAGVSTAFDLFRALLPSTVSAYANYSLAPEPVEAGNWPALYTSGISGSEHAYLYFPYLPNSSSRAVVREVAIDADTGRIYVEKVSAIASPGWIIDSVLKQRLSTEQLLQSSFGQFDEPTPLEFNGQRFYAFPITSKQGSAVIAYAVTDTNISESTGQVQAQFFKKPQEVEKWMTNPQFSSQSLREVFLGQQQPSTQPINSQEIVGETKLEAKIDALTQKIDALVKAIEAQSKK